ncbi:hypothetical protein DNTS_033807 [Danionella cerebrum]|uniref:Ig-like domain-containing protein n=1 Tax=Danionella cerebrum TaxID=2873325 RepID=A0A553ML66_9TELE|nr:hypothetical protein DNTS_033807 [Danionella translucida]
MKNDAFALRKKVIGRMVWEFSLPLYHYGESLSIVREENPYLATQRRYVLSQVLNRHRSDWSQWGLRSLSLASPVCCRMLLDERHPAGVGGESRALLLLLPLFLSLRQTEAHIQIPADLKQAPVFRTQPVSHTAFYVEDLNLSCEASGDPPPSFRWLKDGSQFGDELFGSGTLTPDPMDLTKDLRFYQGIYRCYAGNELGTAVSNLVHIITEREFFFRHWLPAACPKWFLEGLVPERLVPA